MEMRYRHWRDRDKPQTREERREAMETFVEGKYEAMENSVNRMVEFVDTVEGIEKSASREEVEEALGAQLKHAQDGVSKEVQRKVSRFRRFILPDDPKFKQMDEARQRRFRMSRLEIERDLARDKDARLLLSQARLHDSLLSKWETVRKYEEDADLLQSVLEKEVLWRVDQDPVDIEFSTFGVTCVLPEGTRINHSDDTESQELFKIHGSAIPGTPIMIACQGPGFEQTKQHEQIHNLVDAAGEGLRYTLPDRGVIEMFDIDSLVSFYKPQEQHLMVWGTPATPEEYAWNQLEETLEPNIVQAAFKEELVAELANAERRRFAFGGGPIEAGRSLSTFTLRTIELIKAAKRLHDQYPEEYGAHKISRLTREIVDSLQESVRKLDTASFVGRYHSPEAHKFVHVAAAVLDMKDYKHIKKLMERKFGKESVDALVKAKHAVEGNGTLKDVSTFLRQFRRSGIAEMPSGFELLNEVMEELWMGRRLYSFVGIASAEDVHELCRLADAIDGWLHSEQGVEVPEGQSFTKAIWGNVITKVLNTVDRTGEGSDLLEEVPEEYTFLLKGKIGDRARRSVRSIQEKKGKPLVEEDLHDLPYWHLVEKFGLEDEYRRYL